MQLQVCQCAGLARFTLPDKCRLVLSPRREMPVEAVVSNVDLAADEPFSKRLVPLEHGVPFAKPVEVLSLLCPKCDWISRRLSIYPLIFLKAAYVCVCSKISRRWKQPVFVKDRLDRAGLWHISKV